MRQRLAILACAVLLAPLARATDFDRARQMWNLLNSGTLLRETDPAAVRMVEALHGARPLEAAEIAVLDVRSTWAAVHVRQLFAPMTSTSGKDPGQPVGDFVLTAMYSALEDHPFSSWLTTNRVYSASSNGNYTFTDQADLDGAVKAIYRDADLRTLLDNGTFYATKQTYLADPGAAGLLTTQQYGKVAYEMGTNRRVIRKSFEDFLCLDLHNIMNFGFADVWIGRDVNRAPGGKAETFQQTCRGCHSAMDALRGAFSSYDFQDDTLQFRAGRVFAKYASNAATFPEGHVTTTDAWEDFWQIGDANNHRGNGGPAFGRMLASSAYLHSCFIGRIATELCPARPLDPARKAKLAERFRASDDLRAAYEDVAAYHCMDEVLP